MESFVWGGGHLPWSVRPTMNAVAQFRGPEVITVQRKTQRWRSFVCLMSRLCFFLTRSGSWEYRVTPPQPYVSPFPCSMTLPLESPPAWQSCQWIWYGTTITSTKAFLFQSRKSLHLYACNLIWISWPVGASWWWGVLFFSLWQFLPV